MNSGHLSEQGGLRLKVTPMGQQVRGCSCDPRFFPTAMDADCPLHGLATFLRERLERDAQRGGAAA